MRHVPAHYDGEKVVLDEPVSFLQIRRLKSSSRIPKRS